MTAIIVGGGIVGLATALALTERGEDVVVLEAEDRLAAHQSGRNSGVIHAGLYYRPGSLKARLCVEGQRALFGFCAEQGITCRQCGKVVVAVDESERTALDAIEQRGRANGLRDLRRLSADELREREPHAAGVAALLVPETGVVDFADVTRRYAAIVADRGGEIRTSSAVLAARIDETGVLVETTSGVVRGRRAVNCAGLHADRVARLFGAVPDITLVPFRGEYRRLAPQAEGLVRHLIYPVPDPRYPFLGVHFTRMIDGTVEVGPNAVLALSRHGYDWSKLSVGDMLETLGSPGFRRLALQHWRFGLAEIRRSLSRRALARGARQLVPEVTAQHLLPGRAGVRAQAVDSDGSLIDDFRIIEDGPVVHVLNAPSPAATASLAIGRHLADLLI